MEWHEAHVLNLRLLKCLAINRSKSKAIITARCVSEGFLGLAAEKPQLNPSLSFGLQVLERRNFKRRTPGRNSGKTAITWLELLIMWGTIVVWR